MKGIEVAQGKDMKKMETPKPAKGVWTLVAPSGSKYQGESPIKCCRSEQEERVPKEVAKNRLLDAVGEIMEPATKKTWRSLLAKDELDTLMVNGANDFTKILILRERLRNSLAGSISDEAYEIFNKLGMPLTGGWSEEESDQILGGFSGKCKCSCFGCGIAWLNYPDDQHAGCCPECGKDASLIQARNEWIPIEKCIQPCKTFLVAHEKDLYPVPAFYLIGSGGEKVWLRESEGPEDDSEGMWEKARRYSELLRPPTHFMEIPKMPIDDD